MRPHPRHRKAGFSLIEILIGLAILGVLVGMAVPLFVETIEDAASTALEQQLQRVRTAVDFYSFQHEQNNPGEDFVTGTWSANTFAEQLILASDIAGDTAAAGTVGFPYGPYLTDGMPRNPINDLTSVTLVAPGGSFSTPDDTTGWVYWADSGQFRANTSGTNSDGEAYFDL